MKAGTRVRLVGLTDTIWSPREGCLGTVVDPPEPGVYPDDPRFPDDQVLVLLDDDPLQSPQSLSAPDHERGWTCRIGVESLEPLS